jgi:L-rhamnono-1,4-lactonase
MPQMILDSHIHLWPGSAANPQSHSWMQIGHHLARRYLVNDYNEATSHSARRSEVAGFVYVETDRTIAQDYVCDVSKWAAEPLEEIAFLRRIVEGTPKKDEDFDAEQADLLRGIVAWAPLDRPLHDFLRYMSTAKEIAGERTWNKIKGFRFLVQGIRDQGQFSRLLDPLGSSFVTLLKFLGTRNLSFDVGLDERQGGVWQLELFADTIEQAHNGVPPKDKTIFVLSKLRSLPGFLLTDNPETIFASLIWSSPLPQVRLRV